MVSITWVKKMELDFELWRALYGWSGEPNKTLSNVHVQLPLMQSLLNSYQSCNLILQPYIAKGLRLRQHDINYHGCHLY